jgi:hypothetical protein
MAFPPSSRVRSVLMESFAVCASPMLGQCMVASWSIRAGLSVGFPTHAKRKPYFSPKPQPNTHAYTCKKTQLDEQ